MLTEANDVSFFGDQNITRPRGSTALMEADVVVAFLGCCFFVFRTNQHAVRASCGRGALFSLCTRIQGSETIGTRIGKHGELGVNFTRVVLFDISG